MFHWYVFHAKPHKERQVAEQLRQRGCDVFLPLVRISPVNPRAARERSFFPCYLFARLDLEAVGVNTIQWLPGLHRLVQFGGQPAVVPDNFVHELKRRVAQIRAAGGMVFDGLERGMAVKITSGPFAGYEAIFDLRLGDTGRVRVLLEWVEEAQRRRSQPARLLPGLNSRRVPLELNANSIEKVRRKP